MTGSGGFVPPAYPHDRLAAFAGAAKERFGPDGLIDCSIGTPCDPPADAVVAALAESGAERGYPFSLGSLAYRTSAAGWFERRFGVELDPTAQVAACIGTKELVASTAQYLHLRTPERDVVLYPEVSYPTYAMSATLAGCRAVPVPLDEATGDLLLDRVPDADAERALLLWTNTPSNPTGALGDVESPVRWGRERGIPVFSDECYADFTWTRPPETALRCGTGGVLAVHSLSKRSNLAGVRAGFYAGDPDLVRYLSEVRKHAGLMVPGPVQAAAAVAYGDDAHVDVQRQRYRERLDFMAKVLGDALGIPGGSPQPGGGFYLWVPVPQAFGSEGWGLAAALAEASGLLVSPGDLYGPAGRAFVRVAVVQPMDRLELVADRLAAGGLPGPV